MPKTPAAIASVLLISNFFFFACDDRSNENDTPALGENETHNSDASASSGLAAVYKPGALPTELVQIPKALESAPWPVRVTSPKTEGTYPVVFFFHGFLCLANWYDTIASHLASHGFVVAVIQTVFRDDGLPIGKPKITEETVRAQDTILWLKNNLEKWIQAQPNFDAIGYAGHSRGGKVAWNLIKSYPETLPGAIVGIDPVDGSGIPAGSDVEVLAEPVSHYLPSLIIGTELGSVPNPIVSLGIPCAPKEDGYAHFFSSSSSPSFQILIGSFGHMEMLDERANCGATCATCSTSKGGDRKILRSQIGGNLIAFFHASLEGKDDYYGILEDTSCCPADVTIESK